jgi:hypothetical protein
MTTLIPRQPYSQEEINKLYPRELKLQLVQVVSSTDLPRKICRLGAYLNVCSLQFLRHGASNSSLPIC